MSSAFEPDSSHLTIMRPLLAPSLLNVVVDNLRKGNAEGRLFEMSNIYIPKQQPITELPENACILVLPHGAARRTSLPLRVRSKLRRGIRC